MNAETAKIILQLEGDKYIFNLEEVVCPELADGEYRIYNTRDLIPNWGAAVEHGLLNGLSDYGIRIYRAARRTKCLPLFGHRSLKSDKFRLSRVVETIVYATGGPDVELIVIDENGQQSKPIIFPGVNTVAEPWKRLGKLIGVAL